MPNELVGRSDFLLAVGLGAAIANLLATRLGFPVSTTHMLMGALLGAGLAAEPEGVRYAKLWESFARPLLITPVLALVARRHCLFVAEAAAFGPRPSHTTAGHIALPERRRGGLCPRHE